MVEALATAQLAVAPSLAEPVGPASPRPGTSLHPVGAAGRGRSTTSPSSASRPGQTPLATIDEVAEYLQVSTRTLRRYVEAERLSAIRLPSSRMLRFRWEAVEAFLALGQTDDDQAQDGQDGAEQRETGGEP